MKWFLIMPDSLNHFKILFWVLLLTINVLSSNTVASKGNHISFQVDEIYIHRLQLLLNKSNIVHEYQTYGIFTLDTKDAKAFISMALGISDDIFGSSNNPIRFEDMDIERYGYMDKGGSVVIAPKYFVAKPFDSYHIAAVADEIEWKYIDTTGRTLLKPYLFDNGPDYFKEGLSRYVENDLIGFIDEKYHVVINAQYEFVSPFHNDYATFCVGCKEIPRKQGCEHTKREGGKWGLINKKGRIVIGAMYDKPVLVENHKAKVIQNGKTFYVDQLENGNSRSNATEDEMPGKLVQEIHSIDKKAQVMAESVFKEPSLRKRFESERETLEDRLMYLADELEKIDPALYKTVADQVSESILDLVYVQMETDMVSLRLGRVMEQQKAKTLLEEK